MQNDSPVLSIVVVNSDGTEITLQCLASIFKHPLSERMEVILVDNCSKESCLPEVQRLYPHVLTCTAPRRQGFAKNYNLGMNHARGEFVMILNNDTVVHENCLNMLLHALRQNKTYGMVGPQLLWADGRIQTVCARGLKTPLSYMLELLVLDLGYPLGRIWDAYRRWRLGTRSSGAVPCISGACMLLARETIHRWGALDETYDFYFEDIEWCHRLQRQGLKIAFIREAKVTHFADRSLSQVKVWAKQSEYYGALHYFGQYYDATQFQFRMIWAATLLAFALRYSAFSLFERLTGKKGYASEYKTLLDWVLTVKP